ncbi:MAG: DNA-3-methyladenine glycosylase, partial [Betaproteobacteria bacterium]
YLIGKTLVHDLPDAYASGRIVETEAYLVGDAAAHSFRGETRRNRSLFLERGHAYVYFIYGSCFLFNVSSESPGVGAGVLVRALEPLEGIPVMEARRGTQRVLDLTRGPGRLAVALGIDGSHDGIDLCAGGALYLASAQRSVAPLGTSVRIGITRDPQRMLRFYERGNRFVSGPRKLSV